MKKRKQRASGRKKSRSRIDPNYLRLVGYGARYWRRLLLGGFCGIVFAGSGLSALMAARNLLKTAFDSDQAGMGRIAVMSAVLVGWALLHGLGKFCSEYLIKWVGMRVVTDLRVRIFAHLQDLSVGYYSRMRGGELISRTISDTQMLQSAVSTVMCDLVQQPFMLVAMVGYVLYQDWRLAIGGLVLMPLCAGPVIAFGRRVRRASRQGQERLADLTSMMQEALGGVQVVKAYGGETREMDRFSAQCRAFFRRSMKVVKARAMNDPVVFTVSAIGISVAMIYAHQRGMAWDAFLAFSGALVMMYDPVKKLGRLHLQIEQSAAAAERVFEVLDTPSLVTDRPDARVFAEPLRKIGFENVAFSYGEEPVFSNLTLAVPAGTSLAVVGPSGAGKTTLIGLLLRFFDPTAGKVTLNGIDLRELTLASIRAQIGLVTQETFLFNDTVANNIAYARPESRQKEIEDAARRAHAHDFIMRMPKGYDTLVGERGACISGGQRQRLAIARAILRSPQLLVLDEATSALDSDSERQVQQALDEVMRSCTTIAVAHRLSTVVKCDRIAVLEGGGVSDVGTHAELLERSPLYRRLYDLQFKV